MQWLLFLPQLPATPSSLRVMVWRKMRQIGALGLQNGVWVLPERDDLWQWLNELLGFIRQQGGEAFLFHAQAHSPAAEALIRKRFCADRDEEYGEFVGRCQDFLAEIAKETQQEKFTFAEMEEIEEDLQKLEHWLGKIRARDFFGAAQAESATRALEACRQAFATFAAQVYSRQGLEPPAVSSSQTFDSGDTIP
ncbi:Chromate resistance protein ChrB [uncultured Thermanaerothrix sp.]|uniref:Chromate resistance protein ChrB n=1 Tax=uncultured Thermanaerothrix sp. TaxID=1195149 RepID=UPI00262A2758|nr:Chromate resistance protein ChrB [uncultured Thermanaerothrix sp.]